MNSKMVGSGSGVCMTMVLSHGFGGSQSIWDDVVPQLSKNYRLLLFDWSFSSGAIDDASSVVAGTASFDPSSKYSSLDGFADELISLLDATRLKEVVFVGHSMAGMIGCIASLKRPDLFSHLALVAASPRYLNSKDYEGGFDFEDVEDILSNIESNFATWSQSFAAFAVGANDPISLEKFRKTLQAMRPETALSVAKTIFLGDVRDVLEKVETPCTIIQGTNDAAVPVSVAHYMKNRMKGKASVEIIEFEGHFPQLTCPQKLVDILDTALMPKKW